MKKTIHEDITDHNVKINRIIKYRQYDIKQYSIVHDRLKQQIKVQYSKVQYNTTQYSTVKYITVQYSTVQYSAVQYSTVQYSSMQFSTVQYILLLYVQCAPVPSGRALIAASSETREADSSSFSLDCFSSVAPKSIDSSKLILRE